MSTTQKIRQRLANIPVGKPFISAKFLEFGKRAAVDQALARLVRSGEITRVTKRGGVFVRPIENRFVGNVVPEAFEVAKTLAEEAGAKIEIHGAEAARRFKLTTQVPTKPVFYTTGPSKRFQLGETEVRLKRVSPRKLALAGRPAGQAMIALWYLGKNQVSPEVIEQVRIKLPPQEFEVLKAATSSMPGWLTSMLRQHDSTDTHA